MPLEPLEKNRALLDGFRRGERAALARVFRSYAGDVARLFRRGVKLQVDGALVIVGQNLAEHEIEVLVQETFVKAFHPKARESFDGVRPYGAWLATIARNILVDRARRLRREAKVVCHVEDIDGIEDAGSIDPTWQLEEAALAKILATFEASLDEMDRALFRLRVREGRTHKEAAQSLGITVIMVRRRDARLRVLLLARLRADGFLQNATVTIGSSLLARNSKEGRGER